MARGDSLRTPTLTFPPEGDRQQGSQSTIGLEGFMDCLESDHG